MKHLLLFTFILTSLISFAQDSIRILQYNLLNYGNYTDYCTNSNNNHIVKEENLRTIIGFVKPDIFTVNEIGKLNFYHDRLLSEVLNKDGRKNYVRSSATNMAGSDIINMIYYDSSKLTLHSSKVIQSYIRDINLYKLYFKTADLLKGDTIYLNCIVAHLKAGDNNSDEEARSEMASNIIEWLKSNETPGNFLVMGDFNLYTSAEEAYQTLTGIASDQFQFFDPVNSPGDWNNNASFSHVHTQSVSTSGSGCKASGGMDDRFDFILATDQIIEGSQKLRYKAGSYHPIGQDGNHFNVSITAPPNTSVPEDVLMALGNVSDHLPITLVLEVESDILWQNPQEQTYKDISLIVLSSAQATIRLTTQYPSKTNFSLFSLSGQLIWSEDYQLKQGFNALPFSISNLKPGFYLIKLTDDRGYQITLKFIK